MSVTFTVSNAVGHVGVFFFFFTNENQISEALLSPQIHFDVISHAKTIKDIIVRADIPLDRAFLCCQPCHVFPKTPKFSRLNTEISLHSTEIQLNGTKVAPGFGEPELYYILLEKRKHWIYTLKRGVLEKRGLHVISPVRLQCLQDTEIVHRLCFYNRLTKATPKDFCDILSQERSTIE